MTAPEFAVTSAPPTPWISRNTMIETSFQASAHSAEPTMKITKPVWYMRTRPSMSPSRPAWVASSVITSR
jgi:hypothetical protein